MLCRILRSLVSLETSCQAALKNIIFVSKRFYQLSKQPSCAWELVEVHEDVDRQASYFQEGPSPAQREILRFQVNEDRLDASAGCLRVRQPLWPAGWQQWGLR